MCKLKFAAIEHKYSTSFFKLNTMNIQISALKSKISAAKLADSSHSPCDSGLIVDTDNDLSICQPYVEWAHIVTPLVIWMLFTMFYVVSVRRFMTLTRASCQRRSTDVHIFWLWHMSYGITPTSDNSVLFQSKQRYEGGIESYHFVTYVCQILKMCLGLMIPSL